MASLVDIPIDYQQSLIEFSTSLYQGLNKQESVCMSPYSITAAFLLLMIGASGRSKQQISSALFQNSIFSEEEKLKYHKSLDSYIIEQAGVNVSLASANRLFVNNQFTVLQNVREKAKQYFGADISLKDFTKPKTSAYMMNRWVSKQTNGKIKDLIKEKWLDSNTVMLIINAIYFKATWKKQFSPKHTRKGKTRLLRYSVTIQGRNFDMVFILPDEKVGLQNIETKITPKFLKTISTGFKSRFTSIAIPKFKLQSEFDLKTELPKLGVTDIFDDSKANFTDLIVEKIPGLYVMYAVHKAVFNVNEVGVEGAAGTVFGVGFKSGGHFTANRPFLFYVRDVKSGLILFIGRFHPQVRAG
ncbi:SERPINC1 [Mytilus coruscus]|uniref:SERPINC1 n=1 Tax=Mytilus coruscus TaxID=42192 RepID=A0A6J8CS65_MYTCO|nr:SERPINC1 [Mytilus coruscus]